MLGRGVAGCPRTEGVAENGGLFFFLLWFSKSPPVEARGRLSPLLCLDEFVCLVKRLNEFFELAKLGAFFDLLKSLYGYFLHLSLTSNRFTERINYV